ncbi:HigA family addiction module antitoxin [Asticcacaulis sp. BYS171W]|uniref:HigA family addiction module antitoxin n=1 Tax=Asticcacaulis aquaticus TaxID=2984212 RepID=A0ABT5HY56_9CAUL|nr:HigA family addiction module antitoxin [Asticcacaulis aquaticus]MDC7685004.1 HigA family addiction module antitoxin [Asticcacaulis aquaticus]
MVDYIEIDPPGLMLKEDFLDDLNVRPGTFAAAIKVDRAAIKAIIEGRRAITAEMALRFGLFFGTSPEFWLNLQKDYDLRKVKRERLEDLTAQIKPLKVA